MANIKELLHWNLLYSVFKTNGQKLISPNTKEIFNSNILSINRIGNLQSQKSELPKQELVEEVHDKFKNLEQESIEILLSNFTKREVRLLVWSLDYKGKDSILFSKQFFKFISLINEFWRDSYIIPLWYILLKNWVSLKKNETRFQEFINLLKKKCDQYERSRKDVLAIKTHFNFWRQGGVKKFVNYLDTNNIQFNYACSSLNFNAYLIGTDYYYECFAMYLKSIQKKDISRELIEGLIVDIKTIKEKKHELFFLSILITEDKFSAEINSIQQAAFSLIGDPVVKRYWVSSHLNDEENEYVEMARKKLLVLMNKKFIKIFFSKLVQDSRRKVYWLKFIDHIEDIKFVGNKLNYNILKNNQETSKYVDVRYKITRSNQSTCSLIIWARNYVFVEFSDTGSLYIYRKSSFNIKLNHIERIEDLKTWPAGMAAVKLAGSNYLDLQSEGTLAHRGDWESRLNVWMKKYFYN